MKAYLRVESRLAILAIAVFGMAAVLFVPPAITFDGPSHAFRALQVSRGEWRAERYSSVAVGGILPKSHVDFVNTLWNSYWVGHDFGTLASWSSLSRKCAQTPGTARVEFTNTAVYSPVNYALQAFGMRLAALFTASPLAAQRLGCLFNLAGYLAAIVAALELLPRYHRGFLLVATSPLIVVQAASLSADAVNVSLPLLLLAWAWHLRAARHPAGRQLAGLFLLGLTVTLLKPTAVATLVCLGFVPASCFGSRKTKVACLAVFLLSAAALWYGWNRANLDVNVAGWFEAGHPPPSVQKAWFLGNPLRFIAPFRYFLVHDLAVQWSPLYGDVGGWIPPGIHSFLAGLSLLFLAGILGCGPGRDTTDGVWACANVIQATFLVTFTGLTLWLTFGTPGMDHIPAFSGRYLLVAAACLGIAASEVFHGGFRRTRQALFWLALGANGAGLTAILVYIAFRGA